MFKPGDIVRYSADWSTEEERKYIHVLLENRLSPISGKMSRWLIRTINTSLFLAPTEEVEEYMIDKTGFCVNEYGEMVREG